MLHRSSQLGDNHERFVTRVAATEVVWALKGQQDFAVCTSNADDHASVLMFWSDRGYAVRAQLSNYPDYKPHELLLHDFLFRWLPGMSKDGFLAGTNYTRDLAGLELDPLQLQDQILAAMNSETAKNYIDRVKAETNPGP